MARRADIDAGLGHLASARRPASRERAPPGLSTLVVHVGGLFYILPAIPLGGRRAIA